MRSPNAKRRYAMDLNRGGMVEEPRGHWIALYDLPAIESDAEARERDRIAGLLERTTWLKDRDRLYAVDWLRNGATPPPNDD